MTGATWHEFVDFVTCVTLRVTVFRFRVTVHVTLRDYAELR
jgi:hypothetical protein